MPQKCLSIPSIPPLIPPFDGVVPTEVAGQNWYIREIEMPIFDLTNMTCLDQQEPFTDEVYPIITERGGNATRYDLGRDFGDTETVSPNIYFAYDGPATVTLWEDDPIGDDKIGSFTLNNSDRDGRIVLAGSGGKYLLRYDIV